MAGDNLCASRGEKRRAHPSTLLSVGRVIHAPIPGMVVFYSVEGADQPLATPTPLLIPAGGEQRLQLEVLIPADAQLNTRFVFEFEILGVVDDEGLPVEMKVQALVMINEQRAMNTEAGLMQQGTVPHGTSAPVQINLTSTSTLNENTVVYLEGESGWQLTCNKMLVNESGVALDFTPGHINPQSANLRCEVLRMNGPQEGTIAVTVATEDGFLTSSHTLSLMFAPEPEESTMGGVAVMVGGGGFLAILGLTVLVLRRRANGEEEAPSPTNPRDRQHRTLASQKRSRPSTKRFNPQPSNPRSHHRQRSNVDLRFQRRVYPQGGPRNSGNTMVNNTLMGHCESGLLWPNTLQHGTDFGSSSLFVGSARGTYGISRARSKARTTALLGTAAMLTLLLWTWLEF